MDDIILKISDDHDDQIITMTTRAERIDVTLNVEQAEATRDALAKAIYFRYHHPSP